MTPQQQMLWLFNAEREVRGLSALKIHSTLLSQIDLNHDEEMAKDRYFAHPSPINEPQGVFERLTVNPRLSHWTGRGEIIAAGYGTSAAAVFGWMYEDSASAWGHRENILTMLTNPWVGIGILQNAAGSVWAGHAPERVDPPVLLAPVGDRHELILDALLDAGHARGPRPG